MPFPYEAISTGTVSVAMKTTKARSRMKKLIPLAMLGIATMFTGCVTYINEWKPEKVGQRNVKRSDINSQITTKHKYRIQSITVDGADFGKFLYEAEDVAKFMPGVFSADADAIPVTLAQHNSTFSSFGLFTFIGYHSLTTHMPYTLTVHTNPVQTIPLSQAMGMSMRVMILSLFPFSDSSDTPYFHKGWMESPEKMPQGKTVSALAKSHVVGIALALKQLEDKGLIQ